MPNEARGEYFALVLNNMYRSVLVDAIWVFVAIVATLYTANYLRQYFKVCEQDIEDWVNVQKRLSKVKIFKNVSPGGSYPGAICAAPPGKAGYFYNWIRDSAIVMAELIERIDEPGTEQSEIDLIKTIFKEYVEYNLKIQQRPNRSGSVGEPKWNMDGTSFNYDWGRPQDDGPALRAISMMSFLKNQELSGPKKPSEFTEGVIRAIVIDLDYTVKRQNSPCFDIWEEVNGSHFFTRIVQTKALYLGSKLFLKLGRDELSVNYQKAANLIKSELSSFWDKERKIILTTQSQVSGIRYKSSNLDVQVLLGALYCRDVQGFTNISLSTKEVLQTMNKAIFKFADLYPINKAPKPGTALGRYPEDKYHGYNSKYSGNPWPLVTASIGQIYYEIAQGLLSFMTGAKPSPESSDIESAFHDAKAAVDEHLAYFKHKAIKANHGGADNSRLQLIETLINLGDDQINRVKVHTAGSGSMSEQWNRFTGYQQGATDLTWSYSALLSALKARSAVKSRFGLVLRSEKYSA